MSYLDDDLLKSIQQDMEQDKKDFKMHDLRRDRPDRSRVQELRESVRTECGISPSSESKRIKKSESSSVSSSSGSSISSTGPSKVDKSSYYLYKSTDPAKAEMYKPRKVELPTDMDAPLEAMQREQSKGSLWNASGATMEQYDYSDWFKSRLTERLCLLQFPLSANEHARVESVSDMDCSATFILTRGKLRPGYDVTFTAKWKVVDYTDFDPSTAAATTATTAAEEKKKKKKKSTVEGEFKFEDVCDSDPSDEWPFSCKITKGSSKSISRKAHSTISSSRDRIIKVITDVITEFKAKRQ